MAGLTSGMGQMSMGATQPSMMQPPMGRKTVAQCCCIEKIATLQSIENRNSRGREAPWKIILDKGRCERIDLCQA